MWSWLKPIANAAGALLGVGGQVAGQMVANDQSRAEAERDRQFQERMSSTAVQRSVKDYEAAGLNPALAYDRSASSPGGAQATIGNPTAGATANALQYAQTKQALQMAKLDMAQKRADIAKTRVDTDVSAATGSAQAALMEAQRLTEVSGRYQDLMASANLKEYEKRRLMQLTKFEAVMQPASIHQANLRNLLLEAELPGAQNEATYQRFIGPYAKGIGTAREAAGLLGGILNLVPGKQRILRGIETHYEDGRGSEYRKYDYGDSH